VTGILKHSIDLANQIICTQAPFITMHLTRTRIMQYYDHSTTLYSLQMTTNKKALCSSLKRSKASLRPWTMSGLYAVAVQSGLEDVVSDWCVKQLSCKKSILNNIVKVRGWFAFTCLCIHVHTRLIYLLSRSMVTGEIRYQWRASKIQILYFKLLVGAPVKNMPYFPKSSLLDL
jgi:hypothetical protein